MGTSKLQREDALQSHPLSRERKIKDKLKNIDSKQSKKNKTQKI
jgi:hypothetical protein